MGKWLIKSEPSAYSYDDLLKEKKTAWTGIRNFAARLHLRAMQKGDEVFFYHSNEGLAIVGTCKVVKTAYQDPTTDDENWVAVDVAAGKKLKHPVTLATIKADPLLTNMALVRISRLSVSPVTEEEWERVMELGKTDP
jgi:predicted RNA-binding protein with PUA-like domain